MNLLFPSCAFFLISFVDFFNYNIIISASQDILAGTHTPTSTVLLTSVVPALGVILIGSYTVQKIPYGVRVGIGVLCGSTGIVLLAYAEGVKWKLTGVGFLSFSYGLLELSFQGLMSYFESSVISAYSTGTGIGFFAAPLYYLAMTVWLCVSPKITMILVVPLQLLYLLSYYIINKKIEHGNSQRVHSGDSVAYTKLDNFDTEDSQDRSTEEKPKQSKAMNQENDNLKNLESLSWKDKFRIFGKMTYSVFLPMSLAFFSEYLLIQSVLTTIAYKNAPFSPRDHYQYYIFIFMSGELLGRSHRQLLSFIRPSWLYHSTPALLWVLSVLEMLHLFFFIFESWYRFLPNVIPTLVLCITTGLLIGMVFNNYVEVNYASFEGKEREVAMSFTMAPLHLGVSIAALVGIYVEPRLLEHCIATVSNTAYCFTRSGSLVDITAKCGMKNVTSSIMP